MMQFEHSDVGLNFVLYGPDVEWEIDHDGIFEMWGSDSLPKFNVDNNLKSFGLQTGEGSSKSLDRLIDNVMDDVSAKSTVARLMFWSDDSSECPIVSARLKNKFGQGICTLSRPEDDIGTSLSKWNEIVADTKMKIGDLEKHFKQFRISETSEFWTEEKDNIFVNMVEDFGGISKVPTLFHFLLHLNWLMEIYLRIEFHIQTTEYQFALKPKKNLHKLSEEMTKLSWFKDSLNNVIRLFEQLGRVVGNFKMLLLDGKKLHFLKILEDIIKSELWDKQMEIGDQAHKKVSGQKLYEHIIKETKGEKDFHPETLSVIIHASLIKHFEMLFEQHPSLSPNVKSMISRLEFDNLTEKFFVDLLIFPSSYPTFVKVKYELSHRIRSEDADKLLVDGRHLDVPFDGFILFNQTVYPREVVTEYLEGVIKKLEKIERLMNLNPESVEYLLKPFAFEVFSLEKKQNPDFLLSYPKTKLTMTPELLNLNEQDVLDEVRKLTNDNPIKGQWVLNRHVSHMMEVKKKILGRVQNNSVDGMSAMDVVDVICYDDLCDKLLWKIHKNPTAFLEEN